MSRIVEPTSAAGVEPAGPTMVIVEAPGRGRAGTLAWALVGCVLLATSGVVRAIQDRRFEAEKNYSEACPFPLKSLPAEVDGWRLVDGQDKSLDATTTRITGATEHILRTYVDQLTGVTLSVLILFGPAEPVVPHTPQICYPACGFAPTELSTNRTISGPDGRPCVFRTGVFQKSGGRAMLREVAYHSFRLEGAWSPDIAEGRKFPRKNPGIFKIQVQRRVAEGEKRDRDDPIEQFLARMIPEIERRIGEGHPVRSDRRGDLSGPSANAAPAGPGR